MYIYNSGPCSFLMFVSPSKMLNRPTSSCIKILSIHNIKSYQLWPHDVWTENCCNFFFFWRNYLSLRLFGSKPFPISSESQLFLLWFSIDNFPKHAFHIHSIKLMIDVDYRLYSNHQKYFAVPPPPLVLSAIYIHKFVDDANWQLTLIPHPLGFTWF